MAFRHATEAIETVEARGWAPLTQSAAAYLALSTVHLAWNNLTEAEALMSLGLAASSAEPATRCALGLGQVRLDASLGRVDAARERMERLRREFASWSPPSFLARWWVISEAEVDLAAGDPRAAIARVRPAHPQAQVAPEYLCLARAMLAAGDPVRAEKILATLRGSTIGHGSVVEMWLLTALTADRLRDDGRASDAMNRAILAASRRGSDAPSWSWIPSPYHGCSPA